MNQPDNPVEEFRFQLDEFYLDLQEDGSKISILDREKIKQRPFPGLRPFKTSEFQLFKGRDGQAEELIARLKDNHFLAVLGSSGTGKSSLVRAGLIPQLFGGYLHEAGTKWNIAICRPGKDPVANLAVALSWLKDPGKNKEVLYNNYSAIYETLSNSIFGVLEVDELLNSGRPESEKANLLIIVDQFEELFRFDRKNLKNENIESYFVNLLLKASMNTEGSVYVIITMRSEFLGDCVKYRGLPEAINKGQYLVPQLSRQQLKDVIVGPVSLAEKKISDGLVELLINEIDENKLKENLDQLPILQHALMRTYQQAIASDPDAEINYEYYKTTGGMELALANHAESKYMELGDNVSSDTNSSKKQKIAKIIFQALTDASTDQKGGRRPIELEHLYTIAESLHATSEEVDLVIDHFRDIDTSFIMPPINTALYPGLMMDISHESLMRNWNRLHQWITEEVDVGKLYKTLNDRRELNEKKDKDEFIRGILLEELLAWKVQYPNNAMWASRYHQLPKNGNNDSLHNDIYQSNLAFLDISALKHREEINAKELKLRDEMERIQKEKARRKMIRIFAAATSISVFFAIWAVAASMKAGEQTELAFRSAVFLGKQKQRADENLLEADAQRAVAENRRVLVEREIAEVKRLEEKAVKDALQIQKQKNFLDSQNFHLQKHVVIGMLKEKPFYLSKTLDAATKEEIIDKLVNSPSHDNEEVDIGKHIDNGLLADIEAAVSATDHFQQDPAEGLRLARSTWSDKKHDIIKKIISGLFEKNLFYTQQIKPSSYGIPSNNAASSLLAVSKDGSRFAFANPDQIISGRSDQSQLSIDSVYNLSDADNDSADLFGFTSPDMGVMALSYDGYRILSFHRNGKLFEWGSKGIRRIGRPFPSTGDLIASTFSPDGHFFMTASREGILSKWMIEDFSKRAKAKPIYRDSAWYNKTIKRILFTSDNKKMIRVFANAKYQLDSWKTDSTLTPIVGRSSAQSANFSPDGEYALVFGSDTLSIIDSQGKNIKRIRLALLPEQGSYASASGGIEEIALSPDWKKLLVKHGEEYIVYQSESDNDSVIHIGPDIAYRTDPKLRPQKLLALPNAPDQAVFRNKDFIISLDTVGFVYQWELQKPLDDIDINKEFAHIQHITSTYEVKDEDSLLNEGLLASKNKDSLLNAADYYFKNARRGREVIGNFTKSKTLYAKLVNLENSDFQRKLFINSIVFVNDEWREFERSKAKRDYKILVELLRENISIQERQLKLQPHSKKLRKQLSDYYWPLSFYQLFINEYDSAIVSAKRGLELYPANNVINTNLALGYLLTGQFDKADSIYSRFENSIFYSRGQPYSFRVAFIEDFRKLQTAGVISTDKPEIYNKMWTIRKEILKEPEEDYEY